MPLLGIYMTTHFQAYIIWRALAGSGITEHGDDIWALAMCRMK